MILSSRIPALLVVAACALTAGPAAAHSGHHPDPAKGGKAAPESVRLQLPDAPLVDREGRSVRLQRDVLQDRIVVMDFVYTSCTTVCPVVSAILSRVQSALGDRVGSEVRLVSLTVDPVRDTPARLKNYSAKHGAGPGWSWLTGTPQAIGDVLKGAGTYTPNFEDHPAVVMVGDARTGQWHRYYGFVDPKILLEQIDALAASRSAARGATPPAGTVSVSHAGHRH